MIWLLKYSVYLKTFISCIVCLVLSFDIRKIFWKCDLFHSVMNPLFNLMGFLIVFGYFSSNSMFPLFLQLPKKRSWTQMDQLYKYVSDKKNMNCLSVVNFGTTLSSVCSASTAYINLCRGLKYLLEVRYIILDYKFLIFESLCLNRAKTSTNVWKQYILKN